MDTRGQARANGERDEAGVFVDPCDRGDARRVRLAHERAIGQDRDDGEGYGESGHQGRGEAHPDGYATPTPAT